MLRRGLMPVWVGILVLSGMFLIGQDTWPPPQEHTIVGNVTIIEDFPIPELNRTRDIWIYLPPNYEVSTTSYYPVLYMHDGQNLFDVATSSAGEWGIDETLENLVEENQTEGVIVVGIENDEALRVDEYIPWEFDYNGDVIGGEGDEYVDFLVNTLKPYVDANYRTLTDRANTGIGGSSLGGLISLYAGMKYQVTFGKVCAMSSSFWVADNAMLTYLNSITKEYDALIYLDMGQMEGQNAVNDMEDVYNRLLQMGYTQDQVNMVIDPDGQHDETYWRERFPAAFLWLYE